MIKSVFFLFLVFNFSLQAFSDESPLKDRMLADLEFIQRNFEYGYASADWKGKLFDWDVASQMQSAKNKVRKSDDIDIKRFQKILGDFTKSARDYHVEVLFTSTESSYLPFDIRYFNGKYVISHVYGCGAECPITIGDEIIKMDGIAIEKAVADFQAKAFTVNNPATDRALALESLTLRPGSLGFKVPQGSTKIEIKKRKSGKVESYEVDWNYLPERILYPYKDEYDKDTRRQFKPSSGKKYKEKSLVPYYQAMAEAFSEDGSPRDLLGSRKSLLSNLVKEKINAKCGWFSFLFGDETEDKNQEIVENPQQEAAEDPTQAENTNPEIAERPKPAKEESTPKETIQTAKKELSQLAMDIFSAQTLKLPSGKRAGLIRISTYAENDSDAAFDAFISCLEVFQKQTDLLIIDQTNNPGGLLLYMYALASVLTDRPLEVLKTRRMLTPQDIFLAVNIIDTFQQIATDEEAVAIFGETLLGYPVSLAFIQNQINESAFILEQWELGRLYTKPFPHLGIEVIEPHPKFNFTKPILILINEMDFSAAELFPAIFQDNKRASLMGLATAGAGGMVRNLSFINLNGIGEMSYTSAIFQRSDGTILENIGVSPDIPFDFNNHCYFLEDGSISYDIIQAFDDFAENRTKR